MKDLFYETGFEEDFFDNLSFFEDIFYKYKNGNKANFKWVILSLFMLLQSLFVLALKSSHSFYIRMNYGSIKINEITYKFKADGRFDTSQFKIEGNVIWLNSYFGFGEDFNIVLNGLNQAGIKISKEQLISISRQFSSILSFNDLYKRIKSKKYMNQYINSKVLPNNANWNESIEKLIALRNRFIHFSVDSWTIDYDVLNEILPDLLDIAITLINDSNNIDVFGDEFLSKDVVLSKLDKMKIISSLQDAIYHP